MAKKIVLKKEADIYDVAERAGVAISTVSVALRGVGGASEATRQRVLEAAKALNYRPNSAARDLARRTTNLIAVYGYFYSDIVENNSWASNEMLMGIRERLKDTDYSIYMINLAEGPDKGASTLQDFASRRFICGSIWMSHYPDRVVLKELADLGLPVVMVECARPKVDCVTVDNKAGAILGVSHLIKTGRRRIAVAAGMIENDVMTERLNGYKHVLSKAGIKFDPKLVFRVNKFSYKDGYEVAPKILGRSPQPDGIFSLAGDKVALGLMDGLYARGVLVPRDIALVSFDGSTESLYSDPPLTTVEQPMMEAGYKAVELLLKRVENEKLKPQKLILTPKLRLGRSS